MAKSKSDVTLATTDGTYEEAPYVERSEEDTLRAEGRATVDQIPDYHDTHPTLDTSGPEHDVEKQQALKDAYLVDAGLGVPEPQAVTEPVTE